MGPKTLFFKAPTLGVLGNLGLRKSQQFSINMSLASLSLLFEGLGFRVKELVAQVF